MNESLSEDEMRAALFGAATSPVSEPVQHPIQRGLAASTSRGKRLSSRLRVTMHVTREFEGDEEVFVHDANTLSTLSAEGEAKAAAKKKKYRYFDVISVTPVQV
ncbi:hypothetical protein [Pseudomonas sp. HN2-3]|uniref:hypothetical protein n=1 Tax=Pseudomonas sp. HN2-3 TaxID=2886360 RepID=UPI001D12C139|nr:hypothetical protein [Pseudomonas sp. HN2-3]UDU83179.1 hypothetical protein LJX93_09625 [Pseudomonas sp. HN2-3]